MASQPHFVYDPTSTHTFTAVLLHGRGSSGPEFANDLLSLPLGEDGGTLRTRLPGWKWVFPSAPVRWSTVFQENKPAWFEATSLTDTSMRQDLQATGIKESVDVVSRLIREEARLLRHGSNGILLGGISQGAAVGLWTMLCHGSTPLAGFVGVSGWLPFANEIRAFLTELSSIDETGQTSSRGERGAWRFLRPSVTQIRDDLLSNRQTCPLLSVPVFWGHGVDDAFVDVTLGRQARDTLSEIGISVVWKEYSGAEEEGHWLKEPEEVIDIANFLAEIEAKGQGI